MSMSVCLSVCLPLVTLRYAMYFRFYGLCHNHLHVMGHAACRLPLQRITSVRRRAQTNAPAASYWLRCVLDGGWRRD